MDEAFVVIDVAREAKEESIEENSAVKSDSTLQNALHKLGLSNLLANLDDHLDEVRKFTKTSEDHELYFNNNVKKEMLKLSLLYHPDRNKIRNNPKEEIEKTRDMQAILNSTKIFLERLKDEFLKNLDIDYRYMFYANVDISTIGTEEGVERLHVALQYKIIMLSEIKRVKILPNIREFLEASKAGLDDFIHDKKPDFCRHFSEAVCNLSRCIKGYEEITTEFRDVQKVFNDENNEKTSTVLLEIASKYSSQLEMLQSLNKKFNYCLNGSFKIYTTIEPMDSYFVLPFVKYGNALLMCFVMLDCMKDINMTWLQLKSKVSSRSANDFTHLGKTYEDAYSLVSKYLINDSNGVFDYFGLSSKNMSKLKKYCSDKMEALSYGMKGDEVKELPNIYGENKLLKHNDQVKGVETKESIKSSFCELMKKIKSSLEEEFILDSYNAIGIKQHAIEECVRLFEATNAFLKEERDRLARTTEDIECRKQKCDELLEKSAKIMLMNLKENAEQDKQCNVQTNLNKKENEKLIKKINNLRVVLGVKVPKENEEVLEESRNFSVVSNPMQLEADDNLKAEIARNKDENAKLLEEIKKFNAVLVASKSEERTVKSEENWHEVPVPYLGESQATVEEFRNSMKECDAFDMIRNNHALGSEENKDKLKSEKNYWKRMTIPQLEKAKEDVEKQRRLNESKKTTKEIFQEMENFRKTMSFSSRADGSEM